jgi:hypothetical protein
MMALALSSLKIDPNAKNPDQLRRAADLLSSLRRYIKKYKLAIFTGRPKIEAKYALKYNKVDKNTLKGLNLIDLTKFQEITNSFPKEFKQFFFSEEYKDFINSFPLPQENYITEFKNEN